MLGQAGELFRPGTAASSSGLDNVAMNSFGQLPVAPHSEAIVSNEEFEPFSTDPMGSNRGQLCAALSDPSDPLSRNNPPKRKRAASEHTGQLGQFVMYAREQIKYIRARFANGKTIVADKSWASTAKTPIGQWDIGGGC